MCQYDCDSRDEMLIAAGCCAHLCLIVPLDNQVINQGQALGDQQSLQHLKLPSCPHVHVYNNSISRVHVGLEPAREVYCLQDTAG